MLLMLIFVTGEFKSLYNYFEEKKYDGGANGGSFIGFILLLLASCSLVILLNSSFFLSNEKNNSMFTILLANTKDIFVCILSRYLLKGNKFTFNVITGLIISTVGAVMFSLKSINDNMIKNSNKGKKDQSNITIENKDNMPPQVVEIKSSRSSTDNN